MFLLIQLHIMIHAERPKVWHADRVRSNPFMKIKWHDHDRRPLAQQRHNECNSTCCRIVHPRSWCISVDPMADYAAPRSFEHFFYSLSTATNARPRPTTALSQPFRDEDKMIKKFVIQSTAASSQLIVVVVGEDVLWQRRLIVIRDWIFLLNRVLCEWVPKWTRTKTPFIADCEPSRVPHGVQTFGQDVNERLQWLRCCVPSSDIHKWSPSELARSVQTKTASSIRNNQNYFIRDEEGRRP